MEPPGNWSEGPWSEHTTPGLLAAQTLPCPPGLDYLFQGTGSVPRLLLRGIWDAAHPAGPCPGGQEHEGVRRPSLPSHTNLLDGSFHPTLSNPIAPTPQSPGKQGTPPASYISSPEFAAFTVLRAPKSLIFHLEGLLKHTLQVARWRWRNVTSKYVPLIGGGGFHYIFHRRWQFIHVVKVITQFMIEAAQLGSKGLSVHSWPILLRVPEHKIGN